MPRIPALAPDTTSIIKRELRKVGFKDLLPTEGTYMTYVASSDADYDLVGRLATDLCGRIAPWDEPLGIYFGMTAIVVTTQDGEPFSW